MKVQRTIAACGESRIGSGEVMKVHQPGRGVSLHVVARRAARCHGGTSTDVAAISCESI